MGTIIAAVITLVAVNAVSMAAFFLVMKSRFSRDRLLGELRAEIDRLVMDLGREADRDVAILESRIKNLRALMDEADRRILVAGKETARRTEETDILRNMALHGAADEVAQPSPAPKATSQYVPQAVPQVATQQARQQSMPTAPKQPSQQPAQAATQPARAATQQPATQAATQPTPSRGGQKHADSEPVQIYTRPVFTRSERQIEPFVPVQDRVIDMAKRGFTAELISGTLSMPLGEVELILDMNRSSL